MAKSKTQVAPYSMEELKGYATRLEAYFGQRNSLYQQLEKMYALEWDSPPTAKDVKETMSAEPHNAVDTVVKLLVTSDPSFTVDRAKDNEEEKNKADMLERGVKEIVERSSRMRGKNFEKEVVSSLSIFGEVATKVADLRALATHRTKKNALAKYPQHLSPIAFKVLNPMSVFYDEADWGLSTVLEISQRTIGEIKRSWGERAVEMKGDDLQETRYYEIWTYNPFEPTGTRMVWCDVQTDPLLPPTLHGFDFLPYSIRKSHSLSFLSRPEFKDMSMLYTLHKSGTWQRMNLLLTIMATNVQLFVNPKWVARTRDRRKINIDLNTSGGVVDLYTGEDISPLARQLVPKEVYDLLTLLKQQSEESTLPRVVAGASPGGVSAGFAINLLSQGGKLSIYPVEEAANEALTDSVRGAMSWIAKNKYPVKLSDDMILTANDCDAYRFRTRVALRSSVPQDKVAMGNLWSQLIAQGVGDPVTMWEEMGYADGTTMMDRLLEWMFIKQNMQQFVGEQGQKYDHKGLPTSTLPVPMQDGKNPPPPTGYNPNQPAPSPMGTPSPSLQQLLQQSMPQSGAGDDLLQNLGGKGR